MITRSVEWQNLEKHYEGLKQASLVALQQSKKRFQQYSMSAAGITIDYSNNHCTAQTKRLLCALAHRAHLSDAIAALFSGKRINKSEYQPALHTALRDVTSTQMCLEGQNILAEVRAVWSQIQAIADAVRQGRYLGYSGKPITQIVNIGIGGSDVGPKMATHALKSWVHPKLQFFYVSNLDVRDIEDCLACCDPQTTLFIVSSKSFTTRETLSNLEIARAWLFNCAGKKADNQIFAVTANVHKAQALGFSAKMILPFWHWVGGRYSIWSAVSLSLAIALGSDHFHAFLAGAHAMDQHFVTAPFEKNMPVILGLLRIWVNNFYRYNTQAVIVYHQGLKYFPEYLQQLFMESLGKSVTTGGAALGLSTGGILWGGVGTNTQHSFHQLLLQGTHIVPTDFIFPIGVDKNRENHEEMIASCLAQSEIFSKGHQAKDQTKFIAGNVPHNILMLDEMNPACLGALLALYEHKAYVQSVIWDINPFDQWGVQRSKAIMPAILQQLRDAREQQDSKPQTLLKLIARRINVTKN